jgi:hypothetical protein
MTEVFSAAEIEELSAEIDRQLQELQELRRLEIIRHAMSQSKEGFRDQEVPRGDELLIKQKESIESLTKEPMPSFLARFGRAAKADICDKDGMLHKQWEKWGDLNNKDALERLGGVLVAMGFSGDVVSPLAVAAIVVVVHIGLKAFCEDYGHNT